MQIGLIAMFLYETHFFCVLNESWVAGKNQGSTIRSLLCLKPEGRAATEGINKGAGRGILREPNGVNESREYY